MGLFSNKIEMVLFIIKEGGILLYYYPSDMEKNRVALLSSLIYATLALTEESIKKPDRMKVETPYGALYIMVINDVYFCAIVSKNINDDSIWSLLSSLMKISSTRIDKVVRLGMLTKEFKNTMDNILKSCISKQYGQLMVLSQELFRTLTDKRGEIPENLKLYVEESNFPKLVDKNLIKKENFRTL